VELQPPSGKFGLFVGRCLSDKGETDPFPLMRGLSANPLGVEHLPPLLPPVASEHAYAMVLLPPVDSGDWASLRCVRWQGTHGLIEVDQWQDRGPRFDNFLAQPMLLIQLTPPVARSSPDLIPPGDYTLDLIVHNLLAANQGGWYFQQPTDDAAPPQIRHVEFQVPPHGVQPLNVPATRPAGPGDLIDTYIDRQRRGEPVDLVAIAEQATLQDVAKARKHLAAKDGDLDMMPFKVLHLLLEVGRAPKASQQVRDAAHDGIIAAATQTDGSALSGRAALDALEPYYRWDLTPGQVKQVIEAVRTTWMPRDELIRLAGTVAGAELAGRMRELAQPDVSQTAMAEWGGHSWSANLVLARHGDPAAIAQVVKVVDSPQATKDPVVRHRILAKDLGYVRQPQTAKLLLDQLFSETKWPTGDKFMESAAIYAVDPLIEALADVPESIRNLDLSIDSDKRVALLRAWVRSQSDFTIRGTKTAFTWQVGDDDNAPWGELAEGVRLRLTPANSIWDVRRGIGDIRELRPPKTMVSAGASPVLKLAVRNASEAPLMVSPSTYSYEIEFDGKAYASKMDVDAAWKSLAPGEILAGIEFPVKELGGPALPAIAPGGEQGGLFERGDGGDGGGGAARHPRHSRCGQAPGFRVDPGGCQAGAGGAEPFRAGRNVGAGRSAGGALE
jgi:hypothetical protein